MVKFFLQCVFTIAIVTMIVGCGGSGSNTNVGENADAKALAEYEAAVKASEEAMNSAPPK